MFDALAWDRMLDGHIKSEARSRVFVTFFFEIAVRRLMAAEMAIELDIWELYRPVEEFSVSSNLGMHKVFPRAFSSAKTQKRTGRPSNALMRTVSKVGPWKSKPNPLTNGIIRGTKGNFPNVMPYLFRTIPEVFSQKQTSPEAGHARAHKFLELLGSILFKQAMN